MTQRAIHITAVAPEASGARLIAPALLEAIPQLVWTADADGNVTYVNRRWTEYTGLSVEASLGDGWTAAIDPDQRDRAFANWLADVRSGSRASENRLRYRRADGVYRWFLWRGASVRDEQGEALSWIGTNTDIDDEIKLEEYLGASEERYRTLIETAQEGVWIVDAQGNTRYVNRSMAQMLGYSADELFGQPFVMFQHESTRQRGLENFERRKRGEAGTREERFLRRDGTDLWTIIASNPIIDDSGAFTGSLAMVTDITQRKVMESRLLTAAAEYQSLAEATPQIVWSAEPDGSFEYVNGRWTEYTGMSRAQARHWGWVSAISPGETKDLLTTWRQALDTGDDMEAAVRLRRAADGTYRWHVMRARALRGPDKTVARWFGTLTDIHEERRVARQHEIIARTSAVLAESLDRDALIDRLADLCVRELAQYVTIDLYNDERQVHTIGTAHRDPLAAQALRTLRGQRPLIPEYERRAIDLVSESQTFLGTIDETLLAARMRPEYRATIARAGTGSFVCAPLRARGRTIGAIIAYAPSDAPFTTDEAGIFTEIAERAAISIENAELYAREHRVSETLQQALLPARLPDISGITFDAIYQPGATEAQIGGDWYDATELSDGRVLVSIGDVTGRGLRAAVIMGRVRQAIEALATYQSDPAQLLNAADAVLRRTHPDAIVTALVGVIDRKRRTFAYATAGHPTPIVRTPDATLVTLPGRGLPLGLRDAHQPPTSTIVLPPGALMLLYTDGLVESTRDVDEGERRVAAALSDERIALSAHPAAAIKEAVLFDGSNDDVAVFTIAIGDAVDHLPDERPESPLRSAWSMHWSFDARDARSTRDVRDVFVAYLRAKGRRDADYAAAELVFIELIGNVVRHAPGVVDVEIEWRGDAPVLHVLDRGPGYDRVRSLPPQESETGRGLYLVAQLTRDFTVTRLPGYGSHARAVLAVDRIA